MDLTKDEVEYHSGPVADVHDHAGTAESGRHAAVAAGASQEGN